MSAYSSLDHQDLSQSYLRIPAHRIQGWVVAQAILQVRVQGTLLVEVQALLLVLVQAILLVVIQAIQLTLQAIKPNLTAMKPP